MDRELQAVLDEAWRALVEATARRTPFTLGQLGTVGLDGAPRVRAVILRRADAAARSVWFASHAGSAKIAELRRTPRAALAFYDDDAQAQLRLTGRAEIVADAAERRPVWEGLAEHSRALYRPAPPPGGPWEAAETGADDGFDCFAWVRIDVDGMDCLRLAPLPHRRHRFTLRAGAWTGAAIAP